MNRDIDVTESATLEIPIRCESDMYGFSYWLAGHLKLPVTPISLRNFQHMWIWWDLEDRDIRWALDPNLHPFFGELVQDTQIATVLNRRKIYAKPAGLPFIHFLHHSGIDFSQPRNGKTLYVSCHSTAWRDVSKRTLEAVNSFCVDNDVTVLLAWNDRHLEKEIRLPVEIGAGVNEVTSFFRLAKIFHKYEYMITDRMGSHVMYAMACGMKVGLSARSNIDAVFSEIALKEGLEERARFIRSTRFLAERFPGLVIEDGRPQYCKVPELPEIPSIEVANDLGWAFTLPSEMSKL
jgi:hypothetical protein